MARTAGRSKALTAAVAVPKFRHWCCAVWLALIALVLAGCARQYVPQAPARRPAEVRAQLVQLMPAQTSDRDGWATDIYAAFAAQDIAASKQNLCSVLAVTAQESSFQVDPAVPGLGNIARREIERRAAGAHVPRFVLDAALGLKSSNGRSYGERLKTVHTEKELSALFQDFVGKVPLGRQLFGGLNPVHTGGPMQVSVDFAEAHAKDYPYASNGSIRDEVFSRRGGLYFGIAHLLGYSPSYPSPLYRFADFNAGWYASRNAAFQSAVSQVSGIPLALDGDLVRYHSITPGQTELATRSLADKLNLSDSKIRSALEQGEGPDFAGTTLYERIFALADATERKPVPRAVLPGIQLKSPKITRNLTTAWFARRVDDRWQRCMRRVTGR